MSALVRIKRRIEAKLIPGFRYYWSETARVAERLAIGWEIVKGVDAVGGTTLLRRVIPAEKATEKTKKKG